jgi:rubrerythrin
MLECTLFNYKKGVRMNAYEYAMQIEKEGEALYKDLACKSQEEGLKKIFLMLANEEVKHYKMFEKLANNTPEVDIPQMEVYKDAKEIFSGMKTNKSNYDFGEQEISLYQHAVNTEEKSYEFYLEQAQKMSNPKHKEIFETIANEELKHKRLLENVVDFVSKPNAWIQSAEFYKLDALE